MTAFTAIAALTSGLGLLIGGTAALLQAARPLAPRTAAVSFGSIAGGGACLALFILVVSHG